jgi:hypothetical protein
MEVISFTLKSSQIKHIRQIFLQMDTNATAEITWEQYEAYLKDYMSAYDIKSTFKALDYNNSSIITYHKFLAGAMDRSTIEDGNMVLAFEMLTRGQEKFFTPSDIVSLFRNDVSESDIIGAFIAVGLSRHEMVDYDHFKQLMCDSSSSLSDFSLKIINNHDEQLCSTARSDLTEETVVRANNRAMSMLSMDESEFSNTLVLD